MSPGDNWWRCMNYYPEPECEIPAQRLPLAAVEAMSAALISAAQSVYDSWIQVDGIDEEFGAGGICHLIAERLSECLSAAGVEDVVSIQAAVGENHVYLLALLEDGVYSIDIPPGIYETGGGYIWTKREGVVFEPNHLDYHRIDGVMTSDEFRERYCEC